MILRVLFALAITALDVGSQDRPYVPLNHVYIVLDSATFADIGNSAFLRNEFASVRRQESSTGAGQSWSGLYAHGLHTYVEFFPPGRSARPRSRPGFSGIAFSVERSGKLQHVAARLASATGRPLYRDPMTMRDGADTIPWFEQASALYPGYPDSIAQLYTWVMEVRPELMRQFIYRDLPTYEAGITRREYLARLFAPDRYLKDIVGITIALDSLRASRFATELTTLGYTLRSRGDAIQARGPGVEFLITPATTDKFGIVEMRLSLLRPKRGQTRYTFGERSVLTFTGRTAVWNFHKAKSRH